MTEILTTVGAALLSGLLMYFFGYRRAHKSRDAERTAQQLRDMKTAQEVRDDVESLDDTGLADRAAKWLHGDKH